MAVGDSSSLGFLVQALEARSLITQQSISVKAADSINRISTSILHLPRFRLNVVPGLIKVRHSRLCRAPTGWRLSHFMPNKPVTWRPLWSKQNLVRGSLCQALAGGFATYMPASHPTGDHKSRGLVLNLKYDTQELETGNFVVEDDEAELTRICSCLAASADNTMLELEVKVCTGAPLPPITPPWWSAGRPAGLAASLIHASPSCQPVCGALACHSFALCLLLETLRHRRTCRWGTSSCG